MARPFFLNRFIISQCKKLLFQTKVLPKTYFSKNIFTSCFLLERISFKLSDIGEGIREVAVKEWFVKVGDKVSQFDNICEVQSDKASVTITSRYDGVISKLYYNIDDIALVGNPLIDVETNDGSNEDPVYNKNIEESTPSLNHEDDNISIKSKQALASPSSSDDTLILCIPSVRRIAKENNIDLTNIKGTGKDGRILREDLLSYLDVSKGKESEVIATAHSKYSQGSNIVAIKGFTKAMFKTMTESLKIPHFVYSDEINVTKLSKLRLQLKAVTGTDQVKITFLPFFIKAASNALQRYPIINSSIDDNNENIIFHKSHNIGIAMDTKQGLAVPVVKDVENKTIIKIAKDLSRLIESGKKGTFAPTDLAGATFSISNIGVVGGTYTKPVILPPQVAIIAIGIVQVLPRFDSSGNVIPAEIINISGSADHRVIDGVSMANFIKILKKQIENPNLLFLNL